jgi:hypothetical protein
MVSPIGKEGTEKKESKKIGILNIGQGSYNKNSVTCREKMGEPSTIRRKGKRSRCSMEGERKEKTGKEGEQHVL